MTDGGFDEAGRRAAQEHVRVRAGQTAVDASRSRSVMVRLVVAVRSGEREQGPRGSGQAAEPRAGRRQHETAYEVRGLVRELLGDRAAEGHPEHGDPVVAQALHHHAHGVGNAAQPPGPGVGGRPADPRRVEADHLKAVCHEFPFERLAHVEARPETGDQEQRGPGSADGGTQPDAVHVDDPDRGLIRRTLRHRRCPSHEDAGPARLMTVASVPSRQLGESGPSAVVRPSSGIVGFGRTSMTQQRRPARAQPDARAGRPAGHGGRPRRRGAGRAARAASQLRPVPPRRTDPGRAGRAPLTRDRPPGTARSSATGPSPNRRRMDCSTAPCSSPRPRATCTYAPRSRRVWKKSADFGTEGPARVPPLASLDRPPGPVH